MEKTKILWTDHIFKIKINMDDVMKYPLQFKCKSCIRTFYNEKGLKIHEKRCEKYEASFADVLKNKKSASYKAIVELKKQHLLKIEKPTVNFKGIEIENVNKFNYLGCTLSSDGSLETDVNSKVARGLTRLYEARNILTNEEISLQTRRNICKALITPITLYGAEIWDLTSTNTIKKIESLSRNIKRYLSTDLKNYKISILAEDINVLELAKERQKNFLEKIKNNENSPAFFIDQKNFQLDDKQTKQYQNTYKPILSYKRNRQTNGFVQIAPKAI